MLRCVRILAEFFAAFMGMLVLVAVLAIWRLNDSPIRSTFLTPYIEQGIERYIPDAHAQINRSLLKWDNADHSIVFYADGVVIKNGKDKVIAEVPNLHIRLSIIGLIVGQFWPVEMKIMHPQFKLDRHADGRFFFADMATSSDTTDDQTDIREVLKRSMANLTHAYAMRNLLISDAAIEVHDITTNKDWSVSVPEVSLRRTLLQLEGDAKVDLTQKDKIATLELHYAYESGKSLHRFSTQFVDINPAELAGGHPETLGLRAATIFDLPFSGEMQASFNPNLDIASAKISVRGGEGAILYPSFWDKPRSIKTIEIDGDYDLQAKRLHLAKADIDFGGPKLKMTGEGHASVEFKAYDLDYTLNANIENFPMDTLSDFWPKPVVADARDWVTKNLAKGSYEKGEARFDGSLKWSDLENLSVNSGQGTISAVHGSVTYIEGMPVAENVSCEAHFDLKQMTVNVTSGGVGAIQVEPFAATITGLADADQYIDLPMKTTGPIADIVALIDHPPLRFARAVGLMPDALSGTASGVVDLHFPLLKSLAAKDIDVKGSAHLSDVTSSKLVKGIDITHGELSLDLTKDGFSAAGSLDINATPMQLSFQQYFHEMKDKPLRQIDLNGVINDAIWKTLGDDFSGTHGNAQVAFNLTQISKDKYALAGDVDLTGADFYLQPLNWRKSPSVAAKVLFKGTINNGGDIEVKSITLRGPQANADGNATISSDGMIKSAKFDPFIVGRTAASLSFQQSEGKNGVFRFEVHGKSLDVSGIKGGKDPARNDPRPKEYHIAVDKLFTGTNGVIDQAEGYAVRDGEGWSAIDFHGLADGEHKFNITLAPQPDGKRTFSIICDDFGKLLKGLGFTDTVTEGKVKISGQSAPDNPRIIDGTVKIGSFTVGHLPVLALLLNATSPFGFAGLVTNSASFEHMNGAFRWSGDEIDLMHMNAAGESVGMNINGKVDMNSGQANLQGTLVPFSMVNRILGSIPVIGDILTGGDGGGVLAVAYGIKGSLGDPKISVNPVSLLTPGFLRNLFFNTDGDEELPSAGTKPLDATANP